VQRLKRLFSTGLESVKEKVKDHIALSQESLLILQGLILNK
jgi:hypothetical protein